MNEARIEMLKKYISEEPNDPFNCYALANEYVAEKPTLALELFEKIYGEFPDYLANYYHYAQLLTEFEKEEEALEIYKRGIALAEKQENLKTLRELKTAYQSLLFEME